MPVLCPFTAPITCPSNPLQVLLFSEELLKVLFPEAFQDPPCPALSCLLSHTPSPGLPPTRSHLEVGVFVPGSNTGTGVLNQWREGVRAGSLREELAKEPRGPSLRDLGLLPGSLLAARLSSLGLGVLTLEAGQDSPPHLWDPLALLFCGPRCSSIQMFRGCLPTVRCDVKLSSCSNFPTTLYVYPPSFMFLKRRGQSSITSEC